MITFYDIKVNSTDPAFTVSPFCWQARLCLNYKQLPYHTIYALYSNVTAFAKKHGIPPTGVKPDGSPSYTLPAIHDSKTNATVSDSFKIARYLDETYPDTPAFFPIAIIPPTVGASVDVNLSTDGKLDTRVLLAAWESMATSTVYPKVLKLNVGKLLARVEDSADSFPGGGFVESSQRKFEMVFGMRWDELGKEPKLGEPVWKEAEEAVGIWLGLLEKSRGSSFRRDESDKDEFMKDKESLGTLESQRGLWVMGGQFTFADAVVGAAFCWIRSVWGQDSEEWASVKTWGEGRWLEYIEGVEKYATIL
ncbi:hypothetical protein FA15DRAFT_688229 [Coprinopsis marcescibilis]|uniref:GST N-terminal domain-containing protein n=1 Tax=Coprinopsis marcescibilis TaxID=230819 RepID=A0A5C3KQ94_COPMA|nr:hypothetical protein FA15DRAFT_688229 [Coprinopsis marcescibilis]